MNRKQALLCIRTEYAVHGEMTSAALRMRLDHRIGHAAFQEAARAGLEIHAKAHPHFGPVRRVSVPLDATIVARVMSRVTGTVDVSDVAALLAADGITHLGALAIGAPEAEVAIRQLLDVVVASGRASKTLEGRYARRTLPQI